MKQANHYGAKEAAPQLFSGKIMGLKFSVPFRKFLLETGFS